MGLIAIPTTTSYARTSVSQADIGTAATLGVRISIVGQSLLNAAGSGSQFFVIGNTGSGNGGRLFVAGQTVGDILLLAVAGMNQSNPAPVVIQVPRANINAADHYIIRAWAGPAESGISLRHESGSLVESNSGAGATLQFQNADNGRVYCGQYGSVPTLTGAIDGVAVYNTVPPDTVTPPTPDESGLLWAVVDQYGNLVPGAIDLDEFGGGASWTTGGIWDAPAPTITSIDPEEGSDAGGIAVTIIGTGFREGASVSIGGSPATNVTVVSPTTITCTTPAGTAGPSDVVVTNPDGQSDTLEDGFTFTEDVVPVRARVGWVELEVPHEVEDAVTGSGEGVLPDLVGVGSGGTVAAGGGAADLPPLTASGEGVSFITGGGSGTFSALEGAGYGGAVPPVIVEIPDPAVMSFVAGDGLIEVEEPDVVRAQVGWVELEVPPVEPAPPLIVTVPEPAVMVFVAGDGLVAAEEVDTNTGVANIELPKISGDGQGTSLVSGSGIVSLPLLAGTGTTATNSIGAGSANLPAITGAGQGRGVAAGQGSATLAKLGGSGVGDVSSEIGGNAVLPSLNGVGVGTPITTATSNTELPSLASLGTGVTTLFGTGTGILPRLTGQGSTLDPDSVFIPRQRTYVSIGRITTFPAI